MTGKIARLFFASCVGAGETVSRAARVAGFLSAFLLVALVFSYAFHQLQYQWGWETVYGYRQKFINGWLVTVVISAASLLLSLLIGLFFALAQKSRFLPLRYFSKIYIEAIRGTPLLVQILVFFYVVADAFGVGNRYAVGVLLEHGGEVQATAPGTAEGGRSVTVGLRPEHLLPSAAEAAMISGKVEMVEQLGADMLIHFAHGPHTVLARLPHGAQPQVGAPIHFRVDPGHVFLFDAQSGARLQ